MIDRVWRIREPLAVVAILVAVAASIGSVVRLADALGTESLTRALRGVSSLFGLVEASILTATTLACVLLQPRTHHARAITGTATALLSIATLANVVMFVGALADPGGSLSARIVESLGGVGVVVLTAAMAWVARLAFSAASVTEASAPAPESSGQVSPAPPVDPGREPVWQLDQAQGVVWRRAGDAAAGTAATAFGSARSGWQADESTAVPPALEAGPAADAVPEAARPAAEPSAGPRIFLPEGYDGPPVRRSGPPSWDPAP